MPPFSQITDKPAVGQRSVPVISFLKISGVRLVSYDIVPFPAGVEVLTARPPVYGRNAQFFER